jgi:hypothetical protein
VQNLCYDGKAAEINFRPAEIAQLVEQRTENPRVTSSSLVLGIIQSPALCGDFEFLSTITALPSWGRVDFVRTYSSLFGSNIGGNGLESGWNKLGTAVLLMAKTSAGVPQIKNSHGSLSITFTPKGDKRKYLSLGLPESERNRQYAEIKYPFIVTEYGF